MASAKLLSRIEIKNVTARRDQSIGCPASARKNGGTANRLLVFEK
jgi:hypothetical protein